MAANTRPQRGEFLRDHVSSRARYTARLSENPMVWLANRRSPAPGTLWLFPLVLTFFLCIDFKLRVGWAGTLGRSVLVLTHALLIVWAAGWTSYLCAADRKSGAMELLLGTPLGVGEIATGVFRSFRNRFGAPILAVTLIDLVWAAGTIMTGSHADALWPLICAAVLGFDCYCVCWIGLWRGVASHHPTWAIFSAMATTLGLPWVWFGCAAVVFANSSSREFVWLWLLVHLANNTVFLFKARDAFLNHFRVMALRPFASKRPVIESSWSPINWEKADPEIAMR